MKIRSLKLKDFRNYELLKLEPSGSTNIFYGNNAQGKTNILEAVYMCGTTKSLGGGGGGGGRGGGGGGGLGLLGGGGGLLLSGGGGVGGGGGVWGLGAGGGGGAGGMGNVFGIVNIVFFLRRI